MAERSGKRETALAAPRPAGMNGERRSS